MKRTRSVHISDVLRQAVDAAGLTEGLSRATAIRYWYALAGEEISSQCGQPFFRDGVMTIRVASAPLRHELTMSKTRLLSHMNALLGSNPVPDIRFIG